MTQAVSRTLAVVVWSVTRLGVLWLLWGPYAWVTGDVAYFDASLRAVDRVGLDDTLVEYPLPGIVLVAVPWLLAQAAGEPGWYAAVVAALALAADGAFLMALWVAGRASEHPTGGVSRGLWVWLLGVPLLGATAYARFDLVPGVLAGLAVLLAVSRPRWAASAAAVATAVKLWPALLLPALAARRRTRRGVALVVGAVGLAAVGVTVAVAGWERLVSPLLWQQQRGLQVESVLATPAMLGWAVAPDRYAVALSAYHAYEVTGPGVDVLLLLTTLGTVAAALGLCAGWVLAWRSPSGPTADAVCWLCLAATTAFLVVGKVLSPQYLLWLLPMAGAALVVCRSQRARSRLSRWSAVLLLCTGLTQLVFPVLYAWIAMHRPESLWVVTLLLLRNLLLLWLLWVAVREAAWHLTHRGPRLAPSTAG